VHHIDRNRDVYLSLDRDLAHGPTFISVSDPAGFIDSITATLDQCIFHFKKITRNVCKNEQEKNKLRPIKQNGPYLIEMCIALLELLLFNFKAINLVKGQMFLRRRGSFLCHIRRMSQNVMRG
jgi:hypothetical protein